MKELALATRTRYHQRPDPSRVITRLFLPGQELVGGGAERTRATIERIAALSEDEVTAELADVEERFAGRHEDLNAVFSHHASQIASANPEHEPFTDARVHLLGAVFTHEYAHEAAAVCNPSLVPHFDQSGVPPGALRVILTYRAIGEGHRSSIAFRTGQVGPGESFTVDPPAPFPVVGEVTASEMSRAALIAKLRGYAHGGDLAASVVGGLPDPVPPVALAEAVAALESRRDVDFNVYEVGDLVRSIAARFYTATFPSSIELSRRVLWPSSFAESHGMEDARFVRFEDERGLRYLATYTAFDGREVSGQLIETTDFRTFQMSPLSGEGAENKGLAIFPRRVGGKYLALSRCDRESNLIASSEDLHTWTRVAAFQSPTTAWELVQLGNCGSPIELEEGWLVVTHGVGAMRTYSLSALLLDLDDPTRVLARLPGPLLVPQSDERDGYVPNVLYSCGALVHDGVLTIPFGYADGAISAATVPIGALVDGMVPVSD